jgi:hypothetical protein
MAPTPWLAYWHEYATIFPSSHLSPVLNHSGHLSYYPAPNLCVIAAFRLYSACMPPLTRWFVRTAMLYFVAALIVGMVLTAQNVVELPPIAGALTPVYFHLFMVGWVAQLIFGVGYWLFPTLSKEQPRGSERLAEATYGLLNVGLILRAISEPINTVAPQLLWGWLLALSAFLQWLAGMGFVLNSWRRVKGK